MILLINSFLEVLILFQILIMAISALGFLPVHEVAEGLHLLRDEMTRVCPRGVAIMDWYR